MTDHLPPDPSVLAVVQAGDGAPVLIIHGIYETGSLLSSLTARLATRFHVTAPDMRGHGKSCEIPGPMHAESMAVDLVPTLDSLGIEAAHVIGYSHGGATALAFAKQSPERVRSLTLVGTYAFQPLMWWERLAGLVAPAVVATLGTTVLAGPTRAVRSSGGGPRLGVEEARLLTSQMRRNRARRMSVAFAAARTFDSRHWLGTIGAPTLIVVGKSDHMVSPRQAMVLARGIPNAQLYTISGAGHMLPLTHQDEFEQVVMEWLESVDRSTASLPG